MQLIDARTALTGALGWLFSVCTPAFFAVRYDQPRMRCVTDLEGVRHSARRPHIVALAGLVPFTRTHRNPPLTQVHLEL